MTYTMQQVMSEVKAAKAMAQLTPDKYADENGLADSFVQALHGDLKPTQLRKVFHHVKDMQRRFKQSDAKFDRSEVALMMPTLAYSVGRKLIPDDFYQLMKLCFGPERCRTQADFEAAANFLEAIMAYHKYHEGRRK